MFDPSDLMTEAIKHEREAEKCRSLLAQAQKIDALNKELMSANKKIADLEGKKKDENGSGAQLISRITEQSKK